MEKALNVEQVEQLIRDRGLSVAQVCRTANVSQTTFQRWKNGAHLTVPTYNAFAAAIASLSSATTESIPVHQE